jgi:hypothetical protein
MLNANTAPHASTSCKIVEKKNNALFVNLSFF